MDKLKQIDKIEYLTKLNLIENYNTRGIMFVAVFMIIVFVSTSSFLSFLALILEIIFAVKNIRDYNRRLSNLNSEFFEVKPRGKRGN